MFPFGLKMNVQKFMEPQCEFKFLSSKISQLNCWLTFDIDLLRLCIIWFRHLLTCSFLNLCKGAAEKKLALPIICAFHHLSRLQPKEEIDSRHLHDQSHLLKHRSVLC